MSPELQMNELPRLKLKEVLAQFGHALVKDDPRRLEGLLRDHCPEYRREVFVLISTLKAGVPADLLNVSRTESWEMVVSRLVQRLVNDFFISEDVLRWAVETWASALGVRNNDATTATKHETLSATPTVKADHSQEQLAKNLQRWRASGFAADWVERHQGQWNVTDWLELLESLKQSEYWPMEESAFGEVLERLRQDWLIRQTENLQRWRASSHAADWVEAHRGEWTHQDWLELLATLRQSEYWPMEPDAIGEVLEQQRQNWLVRKNEQEEAERKWREQLKQQEDQRRQEAERQRQAEQERQRREQQEAQRQAELKRQRQEHEEAERLQEMQRQSEMKEQQRDEDAWQEAKEKGTVEAYQGYLTAFPKGRYAAHVERVFQEALLEMDDRIWKVTQQQNTVEAYQKYLTSGPNPRHRAEAEQIANRLIQEADERSWQTAQQQNTLEAYQSYICSIPNGRHIAEAKVAGAPLARLADEQAWQVVQQQPTFEAYERYIASQPEGVHVPEAKAVLSPRLRSMLLEDLCSVELRRRYLAARTDEDKAKDAKSLPDSWRRGYFLYGTLHGLITGLVVAFIANWVGLWFSDWWPILQIPARLIVGLILVLIGAVMVGSIAGGIMGAIVKTTFASKSELGQHANFAGFGGAMAFFIGLFSGPICVFLNLPIALITGGGIGMLFDFFIIATKPKDTRQEFGPLPFGDDLLQPNKDQLRKTYLTYDNPANSCVVNVSPLSRTT